MINNLETVHTAIRHLNTSIRAYFESEEEKKEFVEWKAENEIDKAGIIQVVNPK